MNDEEINLIALIAFGSKEQLDSLDIKEGHKFYKAYTDRLAANQRIKEYEEMVRMNAELDRQIEEEKRRLEQLRREENLAEQEEESWAQVLFNQNKLTNWLIFFVICLCLTLSNIDQPYCCAYCSALTAFSLFLIGMTVRNNKPQ